MSRNAWEWCAVWLYNALHVDGPRTDPKAGRAGCAFLEERCIREGQVIAADLRTAYEEYCKSVGERPLGPSALGPGPQIISAVFFATSVDWRKNSLAYIAGAALAITSS